MTAVVKDAELGKGSWISGIPGRRIKLSQATAPEPSSTGRTRVTDREREERRFGIGNQCEQSPGLKAREPSKGARPKRPEENRRL